MNFGLERYKFYALSEVMKKRGSFSVEVVAGVTLNFYVVINH
jgi:hypothetical protein